MTFLSLENPVIEGNTYSYTCASSNGNPQSLSMIWFIDETVITGCANMSLDSECVIHISRDYDGAVLKCQAFQVDYKYDAFDTMAFDVMCKQSLSIH